jgi:hypothetical protein
LQAVNRVWTVPTRCGSGSNATLPIPPKIICALRRIVNAPLRNNPIPRYNQIMPNKVEVNFAVLHKQIKLIIDFLDELQKGGVSLTNNIYANNEARPKMKKLLEELQKIETAKTER